MNALQVAAQVSLFHVIESSVHSVSNHPSSSLRIGLLSSVRAYREYRVLFRSHHDRRDHSVIGASPLASRLATTKSRIEFILLRTGRSPPVALHPASRRRSDFQLQSSNQTLTRTSTSQIRCAHRRTGPAIFGWVASGMFRDTKFAF